MNTNLEMRDHIYNCSDCIHWIKKFHSDKNKEEFFEDEEEEYNYFKEKGFWGICKEMGYGNRRFAFPDNVNSFAKAVSHDECEKVNVFTFEQFSCSSHKVKKDG